MSKTIKITIIHALAIKSAKDETYQKAIVDKAIDQKLVAAAFHEMAGNEAYHEAMLQRSMLTQIELLKTKLFNYLTGEGLAASDATIDSTESNGVTDITLSVSDRFNNGYVKSLARLAQKYVEDRMIHLWWLPVSKDFAVIYATAAEEDLGGILACFHKTAPAAPTYQFPTAIQIRYPVIPEGDQVYGYRTPSNMNLIQPEILYGNPWIITKGSDCEISYVLTGEGGNAPIDDIVVRSDHPCCNPYILPNGGWAVTGVATGYSIITLFSRHDDQVFAQFAIRVIPQD